MQQITIESSSNMTEEEIQNAIRDAQQYAADDAKFQQETEVRRELQNMVLQAEGIQKQMAKSKDKQVCAAARTALKEPIKSVKKSAEQQKCRGYDKGPGCAGSCDSAI